MAAFQATTYRVWGAGEVFDVFDVRLGAFHPALDDALAKQGVRCWAVLSACNPGAVPTPAENASRTACLLERLRVLQVAVLPACNVADAGDWPDEAGVLLLGVDERLAVALATEFGQLACVYGASGEAARLLWCDFND